MLIIGGMTFSGLFSYLSSSSFLFQQSYGFDAQLYGVLFAVNSLGVVLGVQAAARLAARFGPQWVMAWSTGVLRGRGIRHHRLRSARTRACGERSMPLFFFIAACGFTFPCVQVLALDRHGKAAGTAASIIGATNFGVAGLISPVVGWIAHDAGITATTMALVMVGCSVIGVLVAVVRRAAAHGRAPQPVVAALRPSSTRTGVSRKSRAVRPESCSYLR